MTVTINGTSGITTPGLNSTASNVLGDNVADTLNVGNGVIVTNSSGNVGVGTSSPSSVLDVRKDTAAGRTNITFTNGAAANTSNKLRLRLAPDVNFVGTDLQPYVESYVENASNDYSGLAFGTYNGSSIERMRIDSSGNLLISASTSLGPSKLMVVSDFSAANGMLIKNSGSAGASNYFAVFYNTSNGIAGTISHPTSTSTSYNTSSDYRLKENIKPMENALDKVSRLNPVTYTWKEGKEDWEGFIAHELQEVIPQAVTGEKDAVDAEGKPVYQGIDTSFLVATLTKAIQELNAKVTSLEEQILNLGVTK